MHVIHRDEGSGVILPTKKTDDYMSRCRDARDLVESGDAQMKRS